MEGLPINEIAGKAPFIIPTQLANHTTAPRLNTSHIVAAALRSCYPSLILTITPASQIDIQGYAKDGHAKSVVVNPETAVKRTLVANATRVLQQTTRGLAREVTDGKKPKEDEAYIFQDLQYGKFLYTWEGHEFLVFTVECDSRGGNCTEKINFILAPRPENWNSKDESAYDSRITHDLMLKVAEWMMETKEHVLVFDEGKWKKNQKLWEMAQQASWADVVLDEKMKKGLRDDVEGFFGSAAFYGKLRVPWKRGMILHGSPGNGKTLAIQSLMKGLYALEPSVPTLYIKSFAAQQGAQWSIRQIFTKARKTAPCLLVFEDIDSMITDKLRSYFLNEVDGLESNDGIFMLGTTNHLEQLDPALAQRPSRFDRKVFFDRPNHKERAMYARFWAGNIPGSNAENFPEALCGAVADVTDGFSFAYLKELFLATLLSMAREGVALDIGDEDPAVKEETALEEDEVLVSQPGSAGSSDKDEEEEKQDKDKVYPSLSKSVLWPRIKAQAEILRTAIVSEEATGKDYAATGEKGVAEEEDDQVAMKRARLQGLAAQRMMMAR